MEFTTTDWKKWFKTISAKALASDEIELAELISILVKNAESEGVDHKVIMKDLMALAVEAWAKSRLDWQKCKADLTVEIMSQVRDFYEHTRGASPTVSI